MNFLMINLTLLAHLVHIIVLPLVNGASCFISNQSTGRVCCTRLNTVVPVPSNANTCIKCNSKNNDSVFINHEPTDDMYSALNNHFNAKSKTRRGFLNTSLNKVGISTFTFIIGTKPIFAEETTEETIEEKINKIKDARSILKGMVILQSGTEIPDDISKSALYITARPNNPVDVPRAILDGSNGKPPPVLAARFSNIEFPFSFELNTSDLTSEGNARISNEELYWWEGRDLIVSARFDTDGVAATRDPSDLVGRDLFISGKEISIQLQGRGLAGKFFTSKSNK